jgi:replicative DNA helicase
MTERILLPSDKDREDTVIASLMLGGPKLYEVYSEILTKDNFLDTQCQLAFIQMGKLWSDGEDWRAEVDRWGVDHVGRKEFTLFDFMSPQKKSRWFDPGWQIYHNITDPKMLEKICYPLLKLTERRQVMKWAENIKTEARENRMFDLDEAFEKFGTPQNFMRSPFDIDTDEIEESSQDFVSDIDLRKAELDSSGVKTHIRSLNRMIGGLRNGNLIVVGGMPGGGKTSMGVNLAWNAMRNNKRVLFISAEMTQMEITARLVCLEAGVSVEKTVNDPRSISNLEMERMKDAQEFFKGKPLWIDEKSKTVNAVRSAVRRRAASDRGVQLVVVDYLQYIRPMKEGKDLRESLIGVTMGLKAISKEYSVPMVCLAQLGRDSYGKKPSLRNLSETSQIEKEADIVLLLYSEKNKETGIWDKVISIEKNRNGKCGRLRVRWNPQLMLYSDWDDSLMPPEDETIEGEEEVFG